MGKLWKTILLGLYAFIYLDVIGQCNFDSILNSAYEGKKINYMSIKSYSNEEKTTFFEQDFTKPIFTIFHTTENLHKRCIKIGRKNIDSIFPGNAEFVMPLSDFIIDTSNSYAFLSQNEKFCVVPLRIDNCSGTMCRIFSCLLVCLNSKKVFYFTNSELQPGRYFHLNDKNETVYLNTENSFSRPSLFEQWIKEENDFLYKISPIHLNRSKNRWIAERNSKGDKFIIIKVLDQYSFKDCHVVESNW